MTTPTEFRDGLFGAFNTYWSARTPVAWPNKQLDPSDETDAYVELQLAGVPEGQTPVAGSVGPTGQVSQRAGTLGVSIYVRQNKGTDRAYELADDVMAFFEPAQAKTVPGAVFNRISTPQPVGPDGVWWQLLVTASFTYWSARS